MADVSVTLTIRGEWPDGRDRTELIQIVTDAIEREAPVLKAGGLTVSQVDVRVPADLPDLDPATGIEERQSRACTDCGEPLGHAHAATCIFNNIDTVEFRHTIPSLKAH